VALDEMRASFLPTLWTGVGERSGVEQIWFPGVHCDVGGGYPERGLSDAALAWMMEEAAGVGLAFRADMRGQVVPDARDVLHDSRTGVFRHLRTQPRSVPPIRDGEPALHPSVLQRQARPPITQAPYRPTVCLGIGEEKAAAVFAVQHWNDTGLYLEAGGRYRFSAAGQWVDRTIRCGPGGTDDGKFRFGELAQMAGSLWGKAEEAFQLATRNPTADFYGTRREETLPWFSLVGAIANSGNPGPDGTPEPAEIIGIRDGCDYTVKESGYLSCFANDAWHFYDNNRGSVVLRVERIG
jgi:hypothetical protein